MASSLSKYAFVNAKLRARISKILPDEFFERLVKAVSLDAALAILRESTFAPLEQIYSSTGDIKKAELELLKDEIELYRNLQQYLKADLIAFVEALLYQFEIDNLKNAIRIFFDRRIRNQPSNPNIHYILYEQIIHDIPLDIIINANNFDEIAGVCEGTPYSHIIKKYMHTVESSNSVFRLEIALDHFYYENLLQAVSKLGNQDRKIALRLIGVEIDLQNIDWLIRLKKFYNMPLEEVLPIMVPGGLNLGGAIVSQLYAAQNIADILGDFIKGKYPGLSTLLQSQTSGSSSRLLLIKRILDEILKQEVNHIMSGYPFTIGIILCYFILKTKELRKIMTVLNAKKYNIPQERLGSIIL